MSKTIMLDRVPRGGIFTLDGVRFVKLDGDGDASFVVTEGTPLENVPFEDEDAGREDHNNFSGSYIQKKIDRWLREDHKAIFDVTVERPIDLTAMDGDTAYGAPLAVGRILTIDEQRKYRRFMPLTDKPYWLATAWTPLRSPNSSTCNAYRVGAGGTLHNSIVYHPYFAARPALYLQSSILVSVEDSEEEKDLSGYTELDLLAELQRRAQKCGTENT